MLTEDIKGALGGVLGAGRVKSVEVLESADSTNNVLKSLAANGAPCGSAVIALRQSAGKGRMGRSFFSPEGGLYLSYLLRPDISAAESLRITGCVAAAVSRAIEALSGAAVGIKWVNDLVLNGKKICGILVESAFRGDRLDYAVVGIGINLSGSREDFPEELRDAATSIFAETGLAVDRAALAAEVIRRLDLMAEALPDCRGDLEYYRARCVTTERQVVVHTGDCAQTAFVRAVGEDFSLAVVFPDGSERVIQSGEATIRTENGYA